MRPFHKFLTVCALLAASLPLAGTTYGKTSSKPRVNTSRLKQTARLQNSLRSAKTFRPRVPSPGLKAGILGKQRPAPRKGTSPPLKQILPAGPSRTASIPRVKKAPTLRDLSPAKGRSPNSAPVASNVNGTRLGAVTGLKTQRFQSIAERLQNSRLDSQVRGANSGLKSGLDKVMPGFADKAKGASGLRDLGGASGNGRNPIGGVMDNFTGGGRGRNRDGGSTNPTTGSKFTHHQDGSTTIEKTDGTVIDVWNDGTIVTNNTDGTTEVNRPNGQTDYYDKEGKKTGTKEPLPDDVSDSGSSRPVTAEALRGIAARLGAHGTPTGEEGSTGGPVDKSKTRQGRIGQTGQPAPDAAVAPIVPDAMQVEQAVRVRLRNVTPILE